MAILVVEDESTIAASIMAALALENREAFHAATLQQAEEFMQAEAIELVVLDVGLPDGSGFDFCRSLQGLDAPPAVVFLTARSEVTDRIIGLELGGDDYVPKPFSPRELIARIRAVLRRKQVAAKADSTPENQAEEGIRVGCLEQDKKRCAIKMNGKVLPLSKNEYALLLYLMRRPGQVFSREQLLEGCWEDPWACGERTVDAHVKMIRAKLRKGSGGTEELIETHRGFGYSLQEG